MKPVAFRKRMKEKKGSLTAGLFLLENLQSWSAKLVLQLSYAHDADKYLKHKNGNELCR